MDRVINRRRQGDLGEASAIEWLTRMGATVLIPFGHSPDYDLVADTGERLLRVQVKTSTRVSRAADGSDRYKVMIATNGGNQSWNGVAKRFDPTAFDYLFAQTAFGRRWFIPTTAIESEVQLTLGGPGYREFEIDRGAQIHAAVYKGSGQASTAVVPPAFRRRGVFDSSIYDRRLGKSGRAILNQKRRVTVPRVACVEAGFQDGDEVLVRVAGDGRLVLERFDPPPDTDAGAACLRFRGSKNGAPID